MTRLLPDLRSSSCCRVSFCSNKCCRCLPWALEWPWCRTCISERSPSELRSWCDGNQPFCTSPRYGRLSTGCSAHIWKRYGWMCRKFRTARRLLIRKPGMPDTLHGQKSKAIYVLQLHFLLFVAHFLASDLQIFLAACTQVPSTKQVLGYSLPSSSSS